VRAIFDHKAASFRRIVARITTDLQGWKRAARARSRHGRVVDADVCRRVHGEIGRLKLVVGQVWLLLVFDWMRLQLCLLHSRRQIDDFTVRDLDQAAAAELVLACRARC